MLLIVGQQLVTSAFKLEVDPLMSTYDMYSTTYAGPDEYERKAGLTYWMVADVVGGSRQACEVSQGAAEGAWRGAAEFTRAIHNCFSHQRIRAVTIEGRRTEVDWSSWRFADEVRVPIAGPIAILRDSPRF